MVCSASPTAAATGISILKKGGNAFDAALAVAGVEWLTLPGACGLGGDLFAVLYDARRDRICAINGSGEVARRASREYYVDQGYKTMPLSGWHAAGVPGAPTPTSRSIASSPRCLSASSGSRSANTRPRALSRPKRSVGRSRARPRSWRSSRYGLDLSSRRRAAEGQAARWRNWDLARTIDTVVKGGADAYYRGEIAQEIVRASQAGGGLFGSEEFAEHQTDLYDRFV
jgi:gamma-glutamyltranspeptidase/glutathione hydrolase